MNKVDVAGLKVDAITKQEFLDEALKRIKQNHKTFVITPYSEFLYHCLQDPKLLEIFNSADFSLADGIGIFWAKKYLDIPLTAKSYWNKVWQSLWQLIYSLAAIVFNPGWVTSSLPEKIVGADLVWDLAKLAAHNNLSIFLLGGFGDTAKIAGKKLKETIMVEQGRTFSLWSSNKNPDDPSVTDEINKVSPDILFVAYGPIKQENWIKKNLPALNVKLAIGVGGSFDYIAGTKSAPPQFIRYSGLEWLWRLVTQPYRLQRIINATFGLASCLWHYKVFNSLPLRPNVAVAILNNKTQVLVCQRKPSDNYIDIINNKKTLGAPGYWQLPQGGVEDNEDLVIAGQREAKEEAGLKSLELIDISKKTHTYIWNNALRDFIRNSTRRNCGQIQHVLYFKFMGGNQEIKVDNKEFISYKWIDIKDLEQTIHPERSGLTKIVAEDLKEMKEKAII